MNQFYQRFMRLVLGLFLFAIGIVITINANIGYAPWDVFHVGLAKTAGINIGTASILIGIIIGIATLLLGEKIGLGTLFNMVMIGIFVDVILAMNVIPVMNNLPLGILMVVVGLFIISFGSYFYIGSAFGAGPRDSLMVALTRISGLPVGLCRAIIELLAVAAGWSLGGMVGIGTILSAFAIGYCIQLTFKCLKFDPTKIKHETLNDTFQGVLKNIKQQ